MTRGFTYILLFTFFTITLPFHIHAQLLEVKPDDVLYHHFQKKTYTSLNNTHTAHRPYLIHQSQYKNLFDSIYDKQSDRKILNAVYHQKFSRLRTKNLTFNFHPVISSVVTHENEYKPEFSYAIGGELDGSIKESVSMKVTYAFHKISVPSVFSQQSDSTGILVHNGKYAAKKDDFSFLFHYLRGHITWNPSRYITLQGGYGKNFIGDGYRSLFLSDNSNRYPFVKIIGQVWRLKYMVLYAKLKDITGYSSDFDLHGKYFVTHSLSWNISRNFNLHFFETVTWSARDSLGHRGFEWQYLNPVIFYRPVEFSLGSSDNVLLGAGFKLKLFPRTFCYGQLLIDEFYLDRILERNGWWGNKFGIQSGIKSFEPFHLKHLYLQAEMNIVRPYTYSHLEPIQNYGHYYQPLAHPLGANFLEHILIVRYFRERFSISNRFSSVVYGEDPKNPTASYGKDIYKSYEARIDDTGIHLFQGNKKRYLFNTLQIEYLLNPVMGLRFFVYLHNRYQFGTGHEKKNSVFSQLGISCNLYGKKYSF